MLDVDNIQVVLVCCLIKQTACQSYTKQVQDIKTTFLSYPQPHMVSDLLNAIR